MDSVIDECIDNFGAPPRLLHWIDRLTYLRIPKPVWLKHDGLKTLFRNLKGLYIEGEIVWGYVVQANALMFSDGKHNCPGELVYTLDESRPLSPEYLGQVAGAIGALKGTKPQRADLLNIADYLTDELIRVYGLEVPESISPSVPCKISTTFFVRKHLPGRRLCRPMLPIVVNPLKPHVALPLPERYWPADFAHWWASG